MFKQVLYKEVMSVLPERLWKWILGMVTLPLSTIKHKPVDKGAYS